MKYYAGIGSRQTPPAILSLMTTIAKRLAKRDFVLRSGGAPGADMAFERGAHGQEIYLPWPGFNKSFSDFNCVSPQAMRIAHEFHPAWHSLSPGGRLLQGRNTFQVLGHDLKTPSEFIICWTPGGAGGGGTGQAIRIANAHNIPVFDLFNDRGPLLSRLACRISLIDTQRKVQF